MAVADGNPIQDLCAEVTCPICLDYFNKPVTIVECGHNFCQDCLTQCWEGFQGYATCPQCRRLFQQKSLMPNRQLANFVGIVKKFRIQEVKKQEKACKKHQEPLKLFCRDDETPICVVCDRSKEHHCHMVIPVEEAAQEYKDQICCCLKKLRQAREKMLRYKASAEEEKRDLLIHNKSRTGENSG
ncbi:zinc finger protein RFP-like [Sceloporus undulatus]|uniref:zinc finger protein RFP-like n=1 Tax=Sceloporus undulatus TaxID=8520 RepID=UPI001C4ACD65|nr:zinc finger protein RFP-like [Sceloporus undulatus]